MAKTCEEYVLKQLADTKAELEEANKIIEELRAPKEALSYTQDEAECIYLSSAPNYYYTIETTGAYNYNAVLKQNSRTPAFVEECLTDAAKFEQFCSMKEKKDYWSTPVGSVDQRVYNYLLDTRYGKEVIILSSSGSYMNHVDVEDGNAFLNEADAVTRRDEVVRKNIENYLKNYKDKFEE